jgi:hypothetical protein
MLGIVHKIAPDASLGFATTGSAANGNIEDIMSQNIRDLAGPNHNCKIIVDDFTGATGVPWKAGVSFAVSRPIDSQCTLSSGPSFDRSGGLVLTFRMPSSNDETRVLRARLNCAFAFAVPYQP